MLSKSAKVHVTRLFQYVESKVLSFNLQKMLEHTHIFWQYVLARLRLLTNVHTFPKKNYRVCRPHNISNTKPRKILNTFQNNHYDKQDAFRVSAFHTSHTVRRKDPLQKIGCATPPPSLSNIYIVPAPPKNIREDKQEPDSKRKF